MSETNVIVPKAKVKLDVVDINRMQEEEAAIAAAIMARVTAPTGDRIRINKDKTFSLPDGSTAPALTAVVVDFVSINEYYKGKFDPKNYTTPVCVAIGVERKEMKPFDASPEKQNKECSSCWANQWKSDGNGKACKDQRMLALLAPDAQEDGPLMVLKVSPTGTRFWDQHVATLANMLGATPLKVLTEVTFEPAVDYATLRFRTVGKNDGWATAFSRHAEARKRLLTEPELAPVVAPEKK